MRASPNQSPAGKGAFARMIVVLVFLAGLPDGRTATVFSALEDGRWVVYCQESEGRRPTRVDPNSNSTEDQTSPHFSADGTWVAFETSGDAVRVFRRGETAGSWVLEGTHASAVRPVWNPGATNWAFIRFTVSDSGEDSDIWTGTANRHDPEILLRQTGNQDYPSISPDGRWMVYVTAQVVSLRLGAVHVFQQLWLADLHRAEPRQLLMNPGGNIEPAWSPDGSHIAWASDRSGHFEIWTVRPDGTGLRQVTSGTDAKTHPAWFPGSERMLVTILHEGRHRLAYVDVSTGQTHACAPFPDRPDLEVRDGDWR